MAVWPFLTKKRRSAQMRPFASKTVTWLTPVRSVWASMSMVCPLPASVCTNPCCTPWHITVTPSGSCAASPAHARLMLTLLPSCSTCMAQPSDCALGSFTLAVWLPAVNWAV